MSQKTSALLAVTIICAIILAILSSVSNPAVSGPGVAFGYTLGGLAGAGALSVICALIAGAVRKGAFNSALYWSLIVCLPLMTLFVGFGATSR